MTKACKSIAKSRSVTIYVERDNKMSRLSYFLGPLTISEFNNS